MLGDITAADEIYIVTGLSARYFYPHLFDGASILASFSIEI
jgi:hypothetical protein